MLRNSERFRVLAIPPNFPVHDQIRYLRLPLVLGRFDRPLDIIRRHPLLQRYAMLEEHGAAVHFVGHEMHRESGLCYFARIKCGFHRLVEPATVHPVPAEAAAEL